MAQPSANWNHGLEVSALSDVGMRRANNQDCYATVLAGDEMAWFQRGHVFVVADGMGAHAAGELASKLAADNVPHTYNKLLDLSPPTAIRKSIMDANGLIHSRGQGSADFQGMGTTCSALIMLPHGAMVAHVGDSRIYRLRNHQLEQLTFDHSLVWEMLSAGEMTESDVPGLNIPKNVITRSLGPNPKVQVDLEGLFPIEVGDTFLLCSDGLTGPVSDEEIGVILDSVPVEEAVQTLIDLANLRGGPDNITVIAVRVKSPQVVHGDIVLRSQENMPLISAGGGQVHPALWIASGVCLLAALVLGLLGSGFLPVALSLLGGVMAGGVALMQKFEATPGRRGQFSAGPYGKGPYRTYPCQANEEFAGKLSGTVDQLRSAASNDGWEIDWKRFDGYRDAGQSAAASGDFAACVVQFCHAIRFMLSQLRALQKSRAGDST